MGYFKNIKEEIALIRERDPAIHSNWEVFLYPSYQVMRSYRLAHKLYLNKHYFLARLISQRARKKTGIEIHPGAEIGKGFFIDHGAGVIIGETTVIGDNVTIYQGVTLGGTGKEKGKRHPTIGNNVMISTGAKVLGSFTIGDNSKIGAGSVVLSEVPSGSTVVGVPGRVVKRVCPDCPQKELDQVHMPDPVKEDIANLAHEQSELTSRIIDLQRELKFVQLELNKRCLYFATEKFDPAQNAAKEAAVKARDDNADGKSSVPGLEERTEKKAENVDWAENFDVTESAISRLRKINSKGSNKNADL
ncbi:MAG: serine O-acetyltransferase [Butyrivibrio sp.]|nr:serine O-acetyltransferase [Butyrivibrio sp.]